MAEVAEAYVSLVPSAKGFKRGIEREIGRDTERAGRDAGTRSGKAFGGAFGGAVKGLAAVVGVGAVTNFFADSINKASELEQSIGGVEAVFGKYADSVRKDSEAAAQNLGLSANAYNELITVSAALLKNKGLADFAKQSKGLVTIGADLAAQYGGSTREAVEALNAAMRGESDPIERYGISLNETAVNAVLASKGLDDLEGKALEQAKTQARLSLITQQSADATGAFARESDTMAGQQARAQAQFENTRAELGQAFLPVMTDLFRLANEKVVPAITEFVEGMKSGEGAGGEFADVLGDLVDIGEGLVDVVSAIPADVLKIGGALAIGAAGVGKFNRAAGSSSLGAFVADLGAAETRAARASRTLQGLGAVGRNVAGAGGMLLLAHSTQQTNDQLSVLEASAGGALSGAALGAFAGPVGAAVGGAIGGIAGGLFTMAKQDKAARKSAEVSMPSWREYGDTLAGVEASITKATRAMVFQRLESSGLLDATRRMGVSDRQVVNAMLGNERARGRLNKEILLTAQLTDEQREALKKEFGAIELSREAQLRKNVAVAKNREELRKARKALRDFMAEKADKTVRLNAREAQRRASNLLSTLRVIAGIDPVVKVNVSTNVLDPSGLLNPGHRQPGGPRALGGPVRPGSAYLVGERGPELFTTSQRGRITSTNDLRQAGSDRPQTVILKVGERQFTAYMSEVADSRVDLMSADQGMNERAFG